MDKKNSRDWRGTCETCGETFAYPDFECKLQPGHHTIPKKAYYHLGGGHIQNVRDRQLFAPMLNLKADMEVRDKITGVTSHQDGLVVSFRPRGLYDSTDPEEQYFLDHKIGVAQGAEGYAEWEKMYLSTEQQLVLTKNRLDDMQRQLREGNKLLDAVKQETQRPAIAQVQESPMAERKSRDAVGVR